MDLLIARLKEFSDRLIDGAVEFSASNGEQQIMITGKANFEDLPSMSMVYALFGATKLAIMVKPDFTGLWSVAIVSIR